MQSSYKKEYMDLAFDLSRKSPKVKEAFSVGAVIVNASNQIVATAYSRETGEYDHAEEIALLKAKRAKVNLNNCILYCTLEPCAVRKSKDKSCSEHIIESGISTIFVGAREPNLFVKQYGIEKLRESVVSVVIVEGYQALFEEVNAELLKI